MGEPPHQGLQPQFARQQTARSEVKSGMQISTVLGGIWAHTSRTPTVAQTTQPLRRKIRAAQYTYWAKGQNAWKATGRMLQRLYSLEPLYRECLESYRQNATAPVQPVVFVWPDVAAATSACEFWQRRSTTSTILTPKISCFGAAKIRFIFLYAQENSGKYKKTKNQNTQQPKNNFLHRLP